VQHTEPTAVIVIGGDPPDRRVLDRLPTRATVFAADSGLDHASALGLHADVLIGDLDSVSAEAVEQAALAGTVVHRHDPDKDATDSELAIDAAIAAGHTRLVVVSGGGGRLDHLFGSLMLLARPFARPLDRAGAGRVEAWIGSAHIDVLHGPGSVVVGGTPGDVVSLVPLGGAARGITTSGLRWPLVDEDLDWRATRGISNELVAATATVSLTDGVLAVIAPHALDTSVDTPLEGQQS
jgi:thiamine pyrophosphokinase